MTAVENLPFDLRGGTCTPRQAIEFALEDIDKQLANCAQKQIEHSDMCVAYVNRAAELSKARDEMAEALVKVMT